MRMNAEIAEAIHRTMKKYFSVRVKSGVPGA